MSADESLVSAEALLERNQAERERRTRGDSPPTDPLANRPMLYAVPATEDGAWDYDRKTAAESLFAAQVPAGVWRVGYKEHRKVSRWKRELWDVAFQVIAPVDVRMIGRVYRADELADYIGTIVPRFVNLLEKRDRPTLQSTFASDYRVCVERIPPKHLHLLTPRDVYYGVELDAQIVWIPKDSRGVELPEGARYSKIGRILRRTAGRPPAWAGRGET